ncbi:hypothetical protein [Kitasatospora sp. NPDC001527]|uniref:hypothetical protein n=1 Tax=Kitasatospora sp. NPDC001527 TaxID=3154519 RepID=UPI00331AA335
MTDPNTHRQRLAARAREVARAAAGLDDPDPTEDTLREAARLRAEARETARAEARATSERNEAAVDAIIQTRRARRNA